MSRAAWTFASSAPSSITWASASLAYWSTVGTHSAPTAFSSCTTKTASDAPSAVNWSSSWRVPSVYPSTSTSCTKLSRKTQSLPAPALTSKMRMRIAYLKSFASSIPNVSSTSIAPIIWTSFAASVSSHCTEMMSASSSIFTRSSACVSSNSRTSWRTKTRLGSATRQSCSSNEERFWCLVKSVSERNRRLLVRWDSCEDPLHQKPIHIQKRCRLFRH